MKKKGEKQKKVFGAFNGHNLQKKNKGAEKVIINDDAQGDTSSSP